MANNDNFRSELSDLRAASGPRVYKKIEMSMPATNHSSYQSEMLRGDVFFTAIAASSESDRVTQIQLVCHRPHSTLFVDQSSERYKFSYIELD